MSIVYDPSKLIPSYEKSNSVAVRLNVTPSHPHSAPSTACSGEGPAPEPPWARGSSVTKPPYSPASICVFMVPSLRALTDFLRTIGSSMSWAETTFEDFTGPPLTCKRLHPTFTPSGAQGGATRVGPRNQVDGRRASCLRLQSIATWELITATLGGLGGSPDGGRGRGPEILHHTKAHAARGCDRGGTPRCGLR